VSISGDFLNFNVWHSYTFRYWNLRPAFDNCIDITTTARRGLKVKAIGQGHGRSSMFPL